MRHFVAIWGFGAIWGNAIHSKLKGYRLNLFWISDILSVYYTYKISYMQKRKYDMCMKVSVHNEGVCPCRDWLIAETIKHASNLLENRVQNTVMGYLIFVNRRQLICSKNCWKPIYSTMRWIIIKGVNKNSICFILFYCSENAQ